MAKKERKKTRKEQYAETLANYGVALENCLVLSFVFTYQMQAELFHYGLMAERPDYFFFDCWEKYANVVAPKDEQNAAVIIAIAEKDGGEKTTPNLR